MLIGSRPDWFSLFFDPNPVAMGDTVLLFRGDQVLLREEGESKLPLWEDLSASFSDSGLLHALSQGARRVFIGEAGAEDAAPAGLSFESVRAFRTLRPSQDGLLLNAVYHLVVWYRTHRFCGACGGGVKPAEHERALVCEACGLTTYPVISPAVIVAITDGDRILLARNARGTFRHFSLIAGFVEVGETAEQAAEREIMEEVGLRVKNLRFFATQPWGLSQSLMIGFQAELDGSDAVTMDPVELAEARWFARSELEPTDNTASIAFEMIERFRTGTL